MPVHRRPVNLMFQSYALFPHLTVAKNVAYGLERERRPKAEIRQRVAEVLDVVGLAAAGDTQAGAAVGRSAPARRPGPGDRQAAQAAAARRAAGRPRPQDPRRRCRPSSSGCSTRSGSRSSSSPTIRMRRCRWPTAIAVMNAGRIEQLASPTELYERPASRFVADFIGSTNLLDGTSSPAAASLLASGDLVAADVAGRNAGSTVSASLRPELIRFDAAPVESGVTSVAGTIARRAVLRGHEPRPRRRRRLRRVRSSPRASGRRRAGQATT